MTLVWETGGGWEWGQGFRFREVRGTAASTAGKGPWGRIGLGCGPDTPPQGGPWRPREQARQDRGLQQAGAQMSWPAGVQPCPVQQDFRAQDLGLVEKREPGDWAGSRLSLASPRQQQVAEPAPHTPTWGARPQFTPNMGRGP